MLLHLKVIKVLGLDFSRDFFLCRVPSFQFPWGFFSEFPWLLSYFLGESLFVDSELWMPGWENFRLFLYPLL